MRSLKKVSASQKEVSKASPKLKYNLQLMLTTGIFSGRLPAINALTEMFLYQITSTVTGLIGLLVSGDSRINN